MAELAVRLLQLIIHNLDREDAGVAGEDDLVLVEHGGPDGVEGKAPQLHGSLVAEEGVGEAAGMQHKLLRELPEVVEGAAGGVGGDLGEEGGEGVKEGRGGEGGLRLLLPEGPVVHLLAELVHGCVGVGADEGGAAELLHQLIDDGGAGDGLAGAVGGLDEREGPLEGVLHGVHLRPVLVLVEPGGGVPQVGRLYLAVSLPATTVDHGELGGKVAEGAAGSSGGDLREEGGEGVEEGRRGEGVPQFGRLYLAGSLPAAAVEHGELGGKVVEGDAGGVGGDLGEEGGEGIEEGRGGEGGPQVGRLRLLLQDDHVLAEGDDGGADGEVCQVCRDCLTVRLPGTMELPVDEPEALAAGTPPCR